MGSRHAWGIVIVLASAVLPGCGGIAPAQQSPQAPSVPGAQDTGSVHALARLKPAGGVIVVGVRPGQRINNVLVGVGDTVSAGQALAVLEGEDEARCQLAVAEAQRTQAHEERARRRDQLACERTHEDRLQKARMTMLEDTKLALKEQDDRLSKDISDLAQTPQAARQRDELILRLDRARIEAYKAYFELEQARADQDLLNRKREVEDRALREGGADDARLERQVELARSALEATSVHAPTAGTVLDVLADGGAVSSGPLLALGNLDTMEAEAEVDQADVPHIAVGDAATVDVLGTSVRGKVTRIGRLVGHNQLANVDPRALHDLRVVRVTIRLDAAEPAARFVNMQVEAVIAPGSRPTH
jgi:HlyD family secretion protein